MNSKIYSAPLEGLTGFVWRLAHNEIFGGVGKYYAPFIAPNQNLKFQTRELRDLSHNEQDRLVPQVLTNKAEHFTWAAHKLKDMGFSEVNLNLGCPSGTVVTKGKGAGALRSPEDLDRLLDGIFSATYDCKLSVKTRTGFDSSDEWPAILSVLSKYPIHELTIHPRPRAQLYKGKADRELFLETARKSKLPLVYNGDIVTSSDDAFDYGCPVMIGRGLIADPALARKAAAGAPATRTELLAYHQALVDGYSEYLSGEVPLVHKLKEIWVLFANSFEDTDKYMKRILKAKRLNDILPAAKALMENCELKA